VAAVNTAALSDLGRQSLMVNSDYDNPVCYNLLLESLKKRQNILFATEMGSAY